MGLTGFEPAIYSFVLDADPECSSANLERVALPGYATDPSTVDTEVPTQLSHPEITDRHSLYNTVYFMGYYLFVVRYKSGFEVFKCL